MSKNYSRLSLKKLNQQKQKRDIQLIDIDRIIKSHQKLRSQRKQKSSERNDQNNVDLINFKNIFPKRQRIKTQAHQEFNYSSRPVAKQQFKNPYLYLLGDKKKSRKNVNFNKISFFKNKFNQLDVITKREPLIIKAISPKNIFFNNAIKNIQNVQGPLTGKRTSLKRQSNQKSDSNIKKKNNNRYISESFQKIDNRLKQKIQQKKAQDKTIKKQSSKVKIDKNLKQKPQINNFISMKDKKLKPQDNQKIQIVFQKPKKKDQFDLSTEQIQLFGQRFPQGFQKIKLLGRGGFSLVWLGQHIKSKKRFAVKQILTQNNHQTHIKQIWFGSYFFQMGGIPKKKFQAEIGIKNLVKIYSYEINKKDTWIFYEKCGQSLGNALYDLNRQNDETQSPYRIAYKPFYERLKQNQNEIKKIIIEVSQALDLLYKNNIVHSDLKTENILVRLNSENQSSKKSIISELKLIDYGSAFIFNSLNQFSMATPEYMAPQILNFILYQNQLQYVPKFLEYIKTYDKSWVIDMWSLGSVLLQIISGIPLWMSLKTIVQQNKKEVIRYGLFAVKGRLFDKIIQKQVEVVKNLDRYLQQQNYSKIKIDDDLRYALKRMLSLDPSKRISPQQLIQFLQKSINHK